MIPFYLLCLAILLLCWFTYRLGVRLGNAERQLHRRRTPPVSPSDDNAGQTHADLYPWL